MQSTRQTGDVILDGTATAPVQIDGAENIHVQESSVNGDLLLVDVEFVFTGQDTDTDAPDVDVESITETKFYGPELEDAYIRNTKGDVIITNAEDVFIEPNAVSGDIRVIGAEQQFHHDVPQTSHSTATESAVGWKQNIVTERPQDDVVALGSKCTVNVSNIRDHADVYVTGWENDVTLTGRGEATVYLIGSNTNLEIGGLLDADVRKIGVDNAVVKQDFPVEELIDQRKSEAFSEAGFGKETVMYQEPMPTEDGTCPVCQANADAIVKRTSLEAYFLFGHPVYQVDQSSFNECEECAEVKTTDVELTEADRQQIL